MADGSSQAGEPITMTDMTDMAVTDSREVVDLLIEELAQVKAARQHWMAEEDALTQRVIQCMEGRTQRTTPSGLVARVVRSSVAEIDEQRLKKALGAQVFRSVSVLKVDRKLLESAIATNRIDAVVVATCMEEKPRKPHVTIESRERRDQRRNGRRVQK